MSDTAASRRVAGGLVFEPRERWARDSLCANPQAKVRDDPGARLELGVNWLDADKHLPVVTSNAPHSRAEFNASPLGYRCAPKPIESLPFSVQPGLSSLQGLCACQIKALTVLSDCGKYPNNLRTKVDGPSHPTCPEVAKEFYCNTAFTRSVNSGRHLRTPSRTVRAAARSSNVA